MFPLVSVGTVSWELSDLCYSLLVFSWGYFCQLRIRTEQWCLLVKLSDWLCSTLVDKQRDSLPISINSALFVVITAANWKFLTIKLIYFKYMELLWEEGKELPVLIDLILRFLLKTLHGSSKWLRGAELSSLEKLGPFNIFQTENLKLWVLRSPITPKSSDCFTLMGVNNSILR